MEGIGPYIRRRRDDLDLSLREFAKKLDYSPAFISDIELGRRHPSDKVLSVDAEWELVGSKAADGSENPVRKGIFTWVMVKQDGHWVFADFHESEFVAMK